MSETISNNNGEEQFEEFVPPEKVFKADWTDDVPVDSTQTKKDSPKKKETDVRGFETFDNETGYRSEDHVEAISQETQKKLIEFSRKNGRRGLDFYHKWEGQEKPM